MAFVTSGIANGQTILATHVTQFAQCFNGDAGFGQPIVLTALSSASAYALDVRNQSTGGALRVRDSSAGTLLQATDSGITLAGIAAALAPFTSDGAALGSTSKMWSDLFLASGAVVNFNNGNVTVTHASGSLTIGGGNLGMGTTPSAWNSAHAAIQLGARGSVYYQGTQSWTVLGYNTYDAGANNPTSIAAAAGMRIVASATGISMQTAGSVGAGSAQTFNDHLTIDVGGDTLVPNTGAQAMTDGFIYIPASTGAASGTPTNRASNRVPLYYDLTNHKLMAYENGVGWKASGAFA